MAVGGGGGRRVGQSADGHAEIECRPDRAPEDAHQASDWPAEATARAAGCPGDGPATVATTTRTPAAQSHAPMAPVLIRRPSPQALTSTRFPSRTSVVCLCLLPSLLPHVPLTRTARSFIHLRARPPDPFIPSRLTRHPSYPHFAQGPNPRLSPSHFIQHVLLLQVGRPCRRPRLRRPGHRCPERDAHALPRTSRSQRLLSGTDTHHSVR